MLNALLRAKQPFKTKASAFVIQYACELFVAKQLFYLLRRDIYGRSLQSFVEMKLPCQ